jgi:mono/diheme cytochrome c family protein
MRQWERLAVGAAISFAVSAAPSAGDAAKGKEIYSGATPKCKVCHSIAGEGNAKGSLDGIGSKLTAADIKAWMRTPKDMATKHKAERKPAMPAYPQEKLSDEDLASLTDYLMSLKK